MKVLLINGSPHEKGCTYTALSEVAGALNKEGVETEIFWIGREPVSGCKACGYCMKKEGCVIKDKVNEINARMDEFDGIVVGSPVYYAGPSGQLCSFLDRMFYSKTVNFAGKERASHPAAGEDPPQASTV